MNKVNNLAYYPRFIFNFNDGFCFSTGDLEELENIKESGKTDYKIARFFPEQKIDVMCINKNDVQEIRKYVVNKLEIKQIKYNLDEPTYGINMNDCTSIYGKEKKWLMEIYVFLDRV